MTVVKNELKLGGLYGAYETKKQAVEELTDKWISALRRKATIKRKKVRLLRRARCLRPGLRSGAGVSMLCCVGSWRWLECAGNLPAQRRGVTCRLPTPPLTGAACVQVKVKPNKKDKARCDKWGVDKTTADEMEYKLWDMQDALDKVRAEQRRVQHEVCPLPPQHAAHSIRNMHS